MTGLQAADNKVQVSYFLSPPKFAPEVPKSVPQMRPQKFDTVNPCDAISCLYGFVYPASLAWMTADFSHMANSNVSQLNYLKLIVTL